MNPKALTLALFFTAALSLWSQDDLSNLFLESNPTGVYVEWNGEPLEGFTPILLRDIPPGNHQFRFFLDGYENLTLNTQLEGGQTQLLTAELKRNFAAMAFPEEDSTFLVNQEVESLGAQFLVREGSYQVDLSSGTLRFVPIFPEESLLGLSTWAIAGSGAAALYLTIQDFQNPWSNLMPISPSTFLSYAALIWSTGLSIGMHNQKARFLEKFEATDQTNAFPPALAREFFDEGLDQLGQGRLENAQASFIQILETYPEADIYPQTIFYLARIHNLLGQNQLAKAEYELIVNYYPASDIYDRSRKALADIAVALGEYQEAADHLEALVYFDPSITQDDILEYRGFLEESIGSGIFSTEIEPLDSSAEDPLPIEEEEGTQDSEELEPEESTPSSSSVSEVESEPDSSGNSTPLANTDSSSSPEPSSQPEDSTNEEEVPSLDPNESSLESSNATGENP